MGVEPSCVLLVGLPCGSVVSSKHYRTACQSSAVALSVGPVMLHALSELELENDGNSGKVTQSCQSKPTLARTANSAVVGTLLRTALLVTTEQLCAHDQPKMCQIQEHIPENGSFWDLQ